MGRPDSSIPENTDFCTCGAPIPWFNRRPGGRFTRPAKRFNVCARCTANFFQNQARRRGREIRFVGLRSPDSVDRVWLRELVERQGPNQ